MSNPRPMPCLPPRRLDFDRCIISDLEETNSASLFAVGHGIEVFASFPESYVPSWSPNVSQNMLTFIFPKRNLRNLLKDNNYRKSAVNMLTLI